MGRVAGVCRGDEPGLVAPQGRRASDPLNFVDEPQSLLIDGRRAGEDLPPFIAESDIPIFKKVVNQTMLITAFGVQSD